MIIIIFAFKMDYWFDHNSSKISSLIELMQKQLGYHSDPGNSEVLKEVNKASFTEDLYIKDNSDNIILNISIDMRISFTYRLYTRMVSVVKLPVHLQSQKYSEIWDFNEQINKLRLFTSYLNSFQQCATVKIVTEYETINLIGSSPITNKKLHRLSELFNYIGDRQVNQFDRIRDLIYSYSDQNQIWSFDQQESHFR